MKNGTWCSCQGTWGTRETTREVARKTTLMRAEEPLRSDRGGKKEGNNSKGGTPDAERTAQATTVELGIHKHI